jgi:hypothetical protein
MKNKSLCLRSMLAVATIAISSSAVASAQYKFTRLNVPGAGDTFAVGINNDNLVVGYYGSFGFSYNPATKIYQYPIGMPGAYYSEANAVNNAGTIVGAYATSTSSGTFGMVDQGGHYSEYQELGCSGTQITGINDYPTMVGYCYDINGNGQKITKEWVGSPWNTTFSCPNATWTMPAAINNWGISGGTITYGTGQDVSSNGYISTTDGDCTTISYPGSAYSAVGGLNDLGTISGTYWPTAGGAYRGFVLVGSTYSPVNVPKAKATSIGQVNNNNWIVGTYVDHKGNVHGFVGEPISGPSILIDDSEK